MQDEVARVVGQFDAWTAVTKALPPVQERKARRRYIVYAPDYGGYVFRCWSGVKGFGSEGAQSMISGVTHWRIARRGEDDYQLSADDHQQLQS
jgi:hypothetical protein